MTDAAEPIAKPYRLHMVAAVALGGLLWWADGRLWPTVAAHSGDLFWPVMLLQLVLGSWLAKSRLGRILAVFLYGAFFWLVAEGLCARAAESSHGRSIILVGGGLVLAVIAANLLWERLPDGWRARIATSRISYGVGSCVLLLLGGGFIWFVIGAAAEGVDLTARLGLTVLLLALGGGLVLALWRLEGRIRAFACWAVARLAWA
ncbi:MAG TPA: hypothetical protein VN157_12070, partial [Caulobacter sp.]|nr:hypothetical protein [Caulobacter sp.]